jgi:hypothetical protein
MVIHHPFLLRKVFGMMIDTDKLASDTFLTYSLLKCSAEFSKFTEKILECSTNNHLGVNLTNHG